MVVVAGKTGALALTCWLSDCHVRRLAGDQMMDGSLFAGSLLTLSSAVLRAGSWWLRGYWTVIALRVSRDVAMGVRSPRRCEGAPWGRWDSISLDRGGGNGGRLMARVINDLEGWVWR